MFLLLCVLLLLPVSLPAQTTGWKGTVEKRGTTTYIKSPSRGYQPSQTFTLEELWRAGDEERGSEEIFGSIIDMARDAVGNVYVIDSQRNVILVFSPTGECINVFGNQGEGPAEFFNPTCALMLPGPKLAVLQSHPARLVRFLPNGNDGGIVTLNLSNHRGNLFMVNAKAGGGSVYVQGLASRGDKENFRMEYFFDLIDEHGESVKTVYSHVKWMNRANPVMHIPDVLPVWIESWAAMRTGTVAISDTTAYVITLCEPTGSKKVLTREYVRRKLSSSEKANILMYESSKYLSVIPPKFMVDDYDADIRALFPQSDGTLWVLTSQGTNNLPSGSCGVFDVFDAAGHFERQVTLRGPHNPTQDSFYFFGQDIVYVTTHTEDSSTDKNDSSPMEVICYRLR